MQKNAGTHLPHAHASRAAARMLRRAYGVALLAHIRLARPRQSPQPSRGAAPPLCARSLARPLRGRQQSARMLLARAGVTVRAGSAALDPEVAARSCLYWAWWRRNRATADLSHGWGANSQWGTDFRRDYIAGGHLHYKPVSRSAWAPCR